MMGEPVLDIVNGGAFVQKQTDPVISPTYALPVDYAAQYPVPLDTTEIIAMCEEITAWKRLPEKKTALKQELWRELNELAFTSGSNYIAFADGVCPEEYYHDGDNAYVNLKNIGAKKSLGISDIMQSAAVAAANWNGINELVGGDASGEGVPGAFNAGTFARERVADLKEKEVRLGMTLVMNGWDRLLVEGDATTRPLEFDGIENYFANRSCTAHTNSNTASGTFSAASFDRFLTESCAKPTALFGNPQVMQELLAAYFQLGAAGSQVINYNDGNRITPGFNFASFVNTAIGRLEIVADSNFNLLNAGGGAIQGAIYALRMSHNGEPLVYKITQIPLALKDLTPGCTEIAFEIWAKTALVIKHCCAHGVYTTQVTGRIASTCPVIG
jgi:hypothetical protein